MATRYNPHFGTGSTAGSGFFVPAATGAGSSLTDTILTTTMNSIEGLIGGCECGARSSDDFQGVIDPRWTQTTTGTSTITLPTTYRNAAVQLSGIAGAAKLDYGGATGNWIDQLYSEPGVYFRIAVPTLGAVNGNNFWVGLYNGTLQGGTTPQVGLTVQNNATYWQLATWTAGVATTHNFSPALPANTGYTWLAFKMLTTNTAVDGVPQTNLFCGNIQVASVNFAGGLLQPFIYAKTTTTVLVDYFSVGCDR